MASRAVASIDLLALHHNYNQVLERVGKHRKIIAMVKANAYGHDLLTVARALRKADAFGVATIDEALQLRQAGIDKPIVVMVGFASREELSLFFHYQLSAVIHHELQLEYLEGWSAEGQMAVWLKLDTGMHRLGFSPKKFRDAWSRISSIASVHQPVQLMTHLSEADCLNSQTTSEQLHLFSYITRSLPGMKSVGNSAAILAFPEALNDVVRPGIMLYGVSPFIHRSSEVFSLEPVMRLSSSIVSIKPLQRGDRVSYGGTWQCPEAMSIAIVGMGYGDGYPRHLKENTPVLLNGVECPIVGRVSMDLLMLDVRRQPNCCIGDEVVFWGRSLPVERIADFAQTSPYELLCQLTERVKRVPMNSSPKCDIQYEAA